MKSIQSRRLGRTLFVGLAVFALGSPLACKAKSKTSAAPSPSGSAAMNVGPCAEYATKVCEKAGPESGTCEAFKMSSELMSPQACTAGLKDIAFSMTKLASLRSTCDTLVKQLCDAVGPKTKTCEMVTTQTKQFPPDRCKMMLEHKDEIISNLKQQESANQPLSAELRKAIAEAPAPSFGPADAKVTVVEFSDFECPYCSKAANVAQQIKQKYSDKVRFVFRQFPLSFHSKAREAAAAALAAHAQGKFWEYHDKLFENQSALDRPSLEKHAKDTGVSLGEFKKSLDEKKYDAQIDADMKLGEQVRVQGTPTMFVNGERVDNPTDYAAVAQMIEKALSGAPPG